MRRALLRAFLPHRLSCIAAWRRRVTPAGRTRRKVKALYEAAKKEGKVVVWGTHRREVELDSRRVRQVLSRHRRWNSSATTTSPPRRSRRRAPAVTSSTSSGARSPDTCRSRSATSRGARRGRCSGSIRATPPSTARWPSPATSSTSIAYNTKMREGSRRSDQLGGDRRRAPPRQGDVELVPAAAPHRRARPRLGRGQGARLRARAARQDRHPAHPRAARVAAAVGRARVRFRRDRFAGAPLRRRRPAGRLRGARAGGDGTVRRERHEECAAPERGAPARRLPRDAARASALRERRPARATTARPRTTSSPGRSTAASCRSCSTARQHGRSAKSCSAKAAAILDRAGAVSAPPCRRPTISTWTARLVLAHRRRRRDLSDRGAARDAAVRGVPRAGGFPARSSRARSGRCSTCARWSTIR